MVHRWGGHMKGNLGTDEGYVRWRDGRCSHLMRGEGAEENPEAVGRERGSGPGRRGSGVAGSGGVKSVVRSACGGR